MNSYSPPVQTRELSTNFETWTSTLSAVILCVRAKRHDQSSLNPGSRSTQKCTTAHIPRIYIVYEPAEFNLMFTGTVESTEVKTL